MLSTIRVDFKGLESSEGFEPTIRVNLKQSDDVRDSLLKEFFQHTDYIKVEYQHWDLEQPTNSNILLTPISLSEIISKNNLELPQVKA